MDYQNNRLVGLLKAVYPLQSGTSSNNKSWQKRDILIETLEKYPKQVVLTVWGDVNDFIRTEMLETQVETIFSVESRQWNDRWITNISLRNINYLQQFVERSEKRVESVESPLNRENNSFDKIPSDFVNENVDDLPF